MKIADSRFIQFLCLLIILFAKSHAFAQSSANAEQATSNNTAKALKVGVAIGEPFAFISGNEYHGIAVDIWQLIAEEQGLKYQYVPMGEHIDDAISKLAAGEIDVLIGPIIPTFERNKLADFTQPYFINQIGFVIPLKGVNFLNALSSIFNSAISWGLIIFLLFTVIYLHLYWFYERLANPIVPQAYGPGIAKTFWIHTLDIDIGVLPTHLRTRQFRFLWLILVTLFFSSITAAITSALTIALSGKYQDYTSLNDFRRKQIAAVISTAPYDISKVNGLNLVKVNDRDEAFHLLLNGKVDAYVDYYSISDYYLIKQNLGDKLMMSGFILKRDFFAFALPINSPLRYPLNLKLNEHKEYGLLKEVCTKYFGETSRDLTNCEI